MNYEFACKKKKYTESTKQDQADKKLPHGNRKSKQYNKNFSYEKF